MFKKLRFVVLLFLSIFICGCGVVRVVANNPLSEQEVIEYVKNKIYEETGDKTEVNIVSKKDLSVCTKMFDGCIEHQKAEGGYSYKVEIVSEENNEIIGIGTYNDGYIVYGRGYKDGKETSEKFESNYKDQKGLFIAKSEFDSILNSNFQKYYIYEDVSNNVGYDIFINSSDYNKINTVLLEFNNIITKYRNITYISFSMYIYKDETAFNNTDFDLYKAAKEKSYGQLSGGDIIKKYTGKKVTRIGSSEGFNHELFTSNGASAADSNKEYVDYKTFSYLVFWYHSEPNAVKHNGSTQIFGVK